jgi:hypothetical protein
MIEVAAKIMRPHFLALDSSHLGRIAADKAAKDRTRQRRAGALEQAFEASGSILVLCWHHLQELFAHRSEHVVADRIAYLQSLPMVAAVASFPGEEIVGTVIDLQCFEAAAAFRNPTADAVAVRDEAARGMLRLVSGADLVRPFLQHWSVMRRAFAEQERRTREVVAISRSDFAGNSDVKIVDLLRGRLRAPDDVNRQFQQLHDKLSADIRQRGDRRIPDPELSSQAFLEEVRRIGLKTIRADDPALQVLQACGFGLSDIGPETTVSDLGRMAVFREKLRMLNEQLGLPWLELVARVKEERLPSGIIQGAIGKFHPDLRERDGSELADRYLACLSAYADITYVDKRTHEASRQARQKSTVFASLVHPIEKAGEYSEITAQMTDRLATSNNRGARRCG